MGISLFIVAAVYFVNVLLFSSSKIISPTEAFFLEGIMFLVVGSLLLLGSGGINLWTHRATVLAAAAQAVFGGDTVGPAEIMRRDVWKAKGFTRLGLVLTLTGFFMLLVYFLSL